MIVRYWILEIDNNSSIIKEVLSLRYCPSLQINKNKFVANDFLPEEKSNYLQYIENSISSEIEKKALLLPKVMKIIGKNKPKKIIVVKNKVANIVI